MPVFRYTDFQLLINLVEIENLHPLAVVFKHTKIECCHRPFCKTIEKLMSGNGAKQFVTFAKEKRLID